MQIKWNRWTRRLAGAVLLVVASVAVARADVGLLLNEPLRVGASKWTGAGHSAVYLSNICAASPVELRLCAPGENGSVITNYRDFGEDRSFEWNAVPLNIYLYGVEDASRRPLYASPTVRWMMQERYRRKYLGGLCTGACVTNVRAHWRETVASIYMRDIYMFMARTTPEQDRELIEKFNHAGNVGHYNGFTYNCADFARDVVNTYFPGAARADHVNDFGITSPKAIAKSFARYAGRHPEMGFHVVRFSEIPGEYPASKDNRKGTEQLIRSNRWRVPLAVLLPYELSFCAVTYFTAGRFDPERELRRHPEAEVVSLERARREAERKGDAESVAEERQKIQAARVQVLGTDEEWRGYRKAMEQYESEAVARGWMQDLQQLSTYAQKTVAASWITMDEDGGLWLIARDGRSHPKVGLSANTLTSGDSDPATGYMLALTRVELELRKKPKDRELLPSFREDWNLLERLRSRLLPTMAAAPASGTQGASH